MPVESQIKLWILRPWVKVSDNLKFYLNQICKRGMASKKEQRYDTGIPQNKEEGLMEGFC